MGNRQSSSNIAPETENKKQKFAADLDISFEHLQPIDNHALQTPSSVETNIKTLADYLAQPAKSEVEIVRAFYVWICSNIEYDTQSYFGGGTAPSSSSDDLRSKSSVCEGYASIFLKLCMEKGIKCKKLSGYSNGYSHKPGKIISYDSETNHAWNAVFVERKWRFIESTWGAGHTDESKKFVKEFSDFYFFTKPEHFIVDHYPYINNDQDGSKVWQLLSKPISIENLSKAFKPSKAAREWEIEFVSHVHEVIEIGRKVEIKLKSSKRLLHNLSINLIDSSGTNCITSAVILAESQTTFRVIVKPKELGNYVLQIFGHIDKTVTSSQLLVEYLIRCSSIEEEGSSFPPSTFLYGPDNFFEARGFNASTFPKAYQQLSDGQMNLSIKTTKPLQVASTIMNDQGSETKDYVLVESKAANEIHISVRLIAIGYYKLTLFSELEGSKKLTAAFHILIFNKMPSKLTDPFPKVFLSTQEYHCRLVAPLHRNLSFNEVTFIMISPVVKGLMVKTSSGKTIAFQKEESGKWNIKFSPTEWGPLKIFAKTHNDEETSYQQIYEYLVVTNPE